MSGASTSNNVLGASKMEGGVKEEYSSMKESTDANDGQLKFSNSNMFVVTEPNVGGDKNRRSFSEISRADRAVNISAMNESLCSNDALSSGWSNIFVKPEPLEESNDLTLQTSRMDGGVNIEVDCSSMNGSTTGADVGHLRFNNNLLFVPNVVAEPNLNNNGDLNGMVLEVSRMDGTVEIEEVGPTNESFSANNDCPNGSRSFMKQEPLDESNGVAETNMCGDASNFEYDLLDAMDGIEDIKISDMDIDLGVMVDESESTPDEEWLSIIKVSGNCSNVAENETFAMKEEPKEEIIAVPPPPNPKCGNTKLECLLDGSYNIPCKRCYKVFYCSEQHRIHHLNDHQPECKTVSKVEVLPYHAQYTMWLKHAAPHFYDLCLNFVLVWPSLTVQWLPDLVDGDDNTLRHQLLVGTLTNQEQNHLIICGIDVPVQNTTDGATKYASKYSGSMYVTKRINHDGEVNRARYMPQDSSIVATKSSTPEVFVFDCKKYPEIPEDSTFAPTLRLRGHMKEGFGLSWSPAERGIILSGSNDALVCMWDLNKAASADSNGRYLNSSRTFAGHSDVVEDVGWHPEQSHLFASVGDDKKLILWDTRANASGEAVYVHSDAHAQDINAVSFSPYSEMCLATGSSDKTVAIWDMRNMSKKLLSLEYHQAEVMQVQWSPHKASVLASTGKDHRVFVWDLADSAEGNNPSDLQGKDSAPLELSFIHGGHTSGVNDISWNLHETGMMASVTEDNILQVWKIAEDLQSPYEGDDLDEDDDDSLNGSGSETLDE